LPEETATEAQPAVAAAVTAKALPIVFLYIS
jgi:hypothetical protein